MQHSTNVVTCSLSKRCCRWQRGLNKTTCSSSEPLCHSPGVDGESHGLGALHQLIEELLPWRRVSPQQGLVREGLLDLARHPVVGVNHALSHGLVDLQRLSGDQSGDVPLLIQLGTNLENQTLMIYIVLIVNRSLDTSRFWSFLFGVFLKNVYFLFFGYLFLFGT